MFRHNCKPRKTVLLALLTLLAVLFTGCASGTDSAAPSASTSGGDSGGPVKSDVTITLQVDATGDELATLTTLCDQFTTETGIGVDIVANATDHEAIMKTKMASDELPDIWETHGWSVNRYGEYAYDLSGEDWVSRCEPSILTVVSDADGKVCAMPVSQWVYGILYNKAVIDAVGIDLSQIKTWDDLSAACQTVKDAGYGPIVVGNMNTTYLAGFLEMSSAFYTNESSPYYAADKLLDGTFDWTVNKEIITTFANLYDAGYLNDNIFTMERSECEQKMGTGQYAFMLWGGTTGLTSIKSYSPDFEGGIIPYPSVSETGTSMLTVGEDTCYAVWKDSEHLEEALQFLNWFSSAENVKTYLDVEGGVPGFTDVVTDAFGVVAFKDALAMFDGNITFTNFFDRDYLPSGMWSVMNEAMETLFNGDVGTAGSRIDTVSQLLQDNYTELFEQTAD